MRQLVSGSLSSGYDRISALAIANRNQVPDEVRMQLGLGAGLSLVEIERRKAALAAAHVT